MVAGTVVAWILGKHSGTVTLPPERAPIPIIEGTRSMTANLSRGGGVFTLLRSIAGGGYTKSLRESPYKCRSARETKSLGDSFGWLVCPFQSQRRGVHTNAAQERCRRLADFREE